MALMRERISVSTAHPFAVTPHVPHAIRLALGSVGMDELRRALCAVARVVADQTDSLACRPGSIDRRGRRPDAAAPAEAFAARPGGRQQRRGRTLAVPIPRLPVLRQDATRHASPERAGGPARRQARSASARTIAGRWRQGEGALPAYRGSGRHALDVRVQRHHRRP
ncbi:hypothetical protein G6F65_021100 [Rhizopus arrhizus]|nr:hypothetical protein G6F65_021100 [Rhizopus arrhizus]